MGREDRSDIERRQGARHLLGAPAGLAQAAQRPAHRSALRRGEVVLARAPHPVGLLRRVDQSPTQLMRRCLGLPAFRFRPAQALPIGQQQDDEHGLQALFGLPDQPALRPVVIHHAGGVAVDPHLLFERAARKAVALAESPVRIHQELGNDEKRNAFHVVGSAGVHGLFDQRFADLLRLANAARDSGDFFRRNLIGQAIAA